MHVSIIEVPSLILAYNFLMNGVHKFDQLRVSNTAAQKEQ